MPQDEHLVAKNNPVHPKPAYTVSKVPGTPKLVWSSKPAAVVSILGLFSSRREIAAGRTIILQGRP